MTTQIRVLVADDHPVVRGGLRALLQTWADIKVVAEAADGEAAVREAMLTRPDVAILDLRMPHTDGVEATRRISRDLPETAVLVLTMFDEDDLVADALHAGARGYLLKGAEPEEIERAVRAVAAGSAILSPQVARHVLGRIVPGARDSEPFGELTAREHDVLDLIAAGLPNAVIAERLGVAPKTIANHISSIFAKLGVATRAEAIVRAREGGLGS